MDKLFIFLLFLIFVAAFIIALIEGIFKGLLELIGGLYETISSLFAGAGIYGIITVVGIVVFIISIIYIINN